jgi:hypothetical protein
MIEGDPPAGTLGSAGDRHEREADRLARAVTGAGPVRHRGAPGSRARYGAAGGALDRSVARAIATARSGGQPVPAALGGRMAAALGADLSAVRVHTDARADALNATLGSRAFTAGADVFVRRGQYRPGTAAGDALLAHELTHTVQQATGRAPAVQRLLEVGDEDFPAYLEKQRKVQSGGKGVLKPGDTVEEQEVEPFTTVGFEAEFIEHYDNSPLVGISHLELAESKTPAMSYTGIPFKLETDAADVIELVTPPFLMRTKLDAPIPNGDDITKLDTRLRTWLEKITQVNFATDMDTAGKLREITRKSTSSVDGAQGSPRALRVLRVGDP